MPTFYTDIDFVLNYYAIPFFNVARDRLNKNIKDSDISEYSIRSIPRMEDALSHSKALYGMTEEDIRFCVKYADEDQVCYPTSFGISLAKFLKRRKKEGHDVRVLTSRYYDRRAGQTIVDKTLGPDIPVFFCDTKNKPLIIKENSFYFEDHPVAAILAARQCADNRVIVPDWPWNRHEIEKAREEEGLGNILCLDPVSMNFILDTDKHEEIF